MNFQPNILNHSICKHKANSESWEDIVKENHTGKYELFYLM